MYVKSSFFSRLTSIERTSFVHLSKLETLILDGNPLEKIDDQTAEALASLENLKQLSLSTCSLRHLPDGILSNFPRLFALDISYNFLTDLRGERDFGGASGLELLDLDGNAFKELSKNMFDGLHSLKTLRVGFFSMLTKVNEGAFSPLISLEKLYLEENRGLTFIHPDAFEDIHAEDFK